MIKHIVLFKLAADITSELHYSVCQRFKSDIESLPQHISCIKEIEVGINSNPNEQWDIALVSLFDSMEDMATYAKHPLHVEASKRLREHLEERSCVDYEI